MIKVKDYSVIHFAEEYRDERSGMRRTRTIVLIYALGEDGVIYEMSGGKWLPLAIEAGMMRQLSAAGPGDS